MTGGAFVFCYDGRLTHVSQTLTLNASQGARDLHFHGHHGIVQSSTEGM